MAFMNWDDWVISLDGEGGPHRYYWIASDGISFALYKNRVHAYRAPLGLPVPEGEVPFAVIEQGVMRVGQSQIWATQDDFYGPSLLGIAVEHEDPPHGHLFAAWFRHPAGVDAHDLTFVGIDPFALTLLAQQVREWAHDGDLPVAVALVALRLLKQHIGQEWDVWAGEWLLAGEKT